VGGEGERRLVNNRRLPVMRKFFSPSVSADADPPPSSEGGDDTVAPQAIPYGRKSHGDCTGLLPPQSQRAGGDTPPPPYAAPRLTLRLTGINDDLLKN